MTRVGRGSLDVKINHDSIEQWVQEMYASSTLSSIQAVSQLSALITGETLLSFCSNDNQRYTSYSEEQIERAACFTVEDKGRSNIRTKMKQKKLQQFEGKTYDPKIQSSVILPCLVLFTFQTKSYILSIKQYINILLVFVHLKGCTH